MFGRKAKRIAELEDQLANQVTVSMALPPGMLQEIHRVQAIHRVRKGIWHSASFRFKVEESVIGGLQLTYGSTIITEGDGLTPYFDGGAS